METLVVVLVLLLSSTFVVSDWCVCKSDQNQNALQKTIDYACGAGADCVSILQNGACYNPNTVLAHCSWAANSYYQKTKATGGTCDFTGTATLTSSDPSISSCSFPSSASSAGTPTTPTIGGTPGATPSTFTPGTGTGTSTGTGTGTGTSTGTGTGTGTGTLSGLGPTGTNSMDAAAADLLPGAKLAAFLVILLSILAFA